MRGLSSNNTSSRSGSTCSFCRSPNHQVSKCPHVPVVWASLKNGIIPLEYLATVQDNDHATSSPNSTWRTTSRYWKSPLSGYLSEGENWGDLFKQASRAYDKWERARQREEAKASGKKSGKRSSHQTCGYCGEKGHTRRTCTHLSSLKADLKKANQNFRKWFYEEYVIKQGLSTGCIIETDVFVNGGYNQPAKTHTIKTIVTEVNWNTINLFSEFENDLDWRKYNNSGISIGHERLQNILGFVKSDVLLKIPFSKDRYPNIDLGWGYQNTQVALCLPMGKTKDVVMSWEKQTRLSYGSPTTQSLKIVSPAPQVLADDWIDGYSDEMSVILKKFSKAELDYLGISEHIREWANKTI